MDEYIKLTENNNISIEIHSLDDLLSAPVRYRLATHMTIEHFGQKVGASPRQIARYEKGGYQNINSSTLNEISSKLDVNINGKIPQKRHKINERNVG